MPKLGTSSFLSMCLLMGSAQAVPESEAARGSRHELHEKAVAGDLNAMYQLGTFYLLRRENELAEKWFKKAGFSKHIPSLWKYVSQLQRKPVKTFGKDLEEGLMMLISLGEAKANLEIAELYADQRTDLFDYSVARLYFQFSADGGDSQAMLRLGQLFMGENDHPQDFNQAYQWFSKAAEIDSGEGHRYAGMCYRYGLGTKKDLKKAWVHYGLGAKHGDLESAYTLATALYEGKEVVQDKGLARRYYEQAAKYSYRDAQIKLKQLQF